MSGEGLRQKIKMNSDRFGKIRLLWAARAPPPLSRIGSVPPRGCESRAEMLRGMVWSESAKRRGQGGGGSAEKQLTLAFDLELGQGSEEVDGVALLVGVADELSIELLVTGKADTAGLHVLRLGKKRSLVRSHIELSSNMNSRDIVYSFAGW